MFNNLCKELVLNMVKTFCNLSYWFFSFFCVCDVGLSDVDDSPAGGRVSWAGSPGKRADKTNLSFDHSKPTSLKPDPKSCLRPPRQRSYSFDSSGENSGPRSTATERRSVSLKSSPREPHAHHGLVQPKPQPERSIFAELRRSSEIFKGILLNLSTREEHQEQKPPSTSSPEPEVSLFN